MLEKNFNTDFTKKLKELGWAYKIPDPDKNSVFSTSKRPFDGFAFLEGLGAVYFESKLIKNKLSAFSLDRIEDHQFESLLSLKALGAFSVVVLAYWVSRKEYCFAMFDPLFLKNLKDKGKKSILGKELQAYKDASYFFSMGTSLTLDIFKKVIDFLPRSKD